MNPIASYQIVDVSYPYKLRGADNQQTDTGLLYLGRDSRNPAGSSNYERGIALGGFQLQNRSGSTVSCGIGVRIPNSMWRAGQWDDSEATAYTDDTTDAQDAGATDFALETLTNDDGFVIASDVPFNAISIDVGTNSAGTDPVRAVRYTDSTGAAWTTLSNFLLQEGASTDPGTGEMLIVWNVPADWGQVQSGGLNGIPASKYAVNVRATTAPGTTAAVADSLSIYRIYWAIEGLADNNVYEEDFGAKEVWMPHGDALVAFFSVANNQNLVRALVRSR